MFWLALIDIFVVNRLPIWLYIVLVVIDHVRIDETLPELISVMNIVIDEIPGTLGHIYLI